MKKANGNHSLHDLALAEARAALARRREAEQEAQAKARRAAGTMPARVGHPHGPALTGEAAFVPSPDAKWYRDGRYVGGV